MQILPTRAALTVFLTALMGSGLGAQDDPYAEDLRAAERNASKGMRARARSIFEEILDDADEYGVGGEGPSQTVVDAAELGLLEISMDLGEYDEVADGIGLLRDEQKKSAAVQTLLARVHIRRGRYEDAVSTLRSLVERAPRDPAPNCLLAETLDTIGKHEEADELFESIVRRSQTESVREPIDLNWVARAHINRGTRGDYERAASLLVDAIRNAPDLVAPKVQYGWLQYLAYGEAAGFASGEKILKEVLRDNGDIEAALLTLYRIRSSNARLDPSKTAELLQRAVDLNPNSVDAKLLQGVQTIDDRRFAAGAAILDSALEVNPRDKRVLAERSAVAYLQGDPDKQKEFAKRALEVDAAYAGVDLALGNRLVALYRFADALAPFERALEIDPDSIEAMHGLAKASVYAGNGARARELLQKAKTLQKGLVNPWRNNILATEELLAEEYDRVETEGFVFRMHKEDGEVLGRYLIPFHEQARSVLGEKYGHVPPSPITVEVLRTWDDFSVRTTGFRGFTALGACFGPLITLVSPVDADLRKNDFMWTATVWHEYAHVLTLELSKARVPRWLTEGFSVYEESSKNPAWERGMVRDLLDAYHNGQIPPVHLLNRLFRGPRILFGYYQGGLIVEYLAREHGFDKVVDMLPLYGQDKSTTQIFEENFGIDTRTFDARFLDYVRNEKIKGLRIVPRWDERAVARMLDRVARNPQDIETHISLAWAMLQRDINVDAADHLRQILKQEPDHPEAALIHAELLLRRGREEDAIEAFERGFRGKADDFDSRIRYGKLLAKRKDLDGAARQFLAAKRCWPRCTDQNVAPPILLAKLYHAQDRRTEAMMELKMFCRLTARAFQPRLTLAEWEREAGHRESEAKLLEECVQIDPFMRSLHVRLADALAEIGRKAEAVRELEVALAVDPAIDREFMDAENPPTRDSAEYRASQAEVCVRIARLQKQLGDASAAADFLERAIREAPDSDAAAEARELQEHWKR